MDFLNRMSRELAERKSNHSFRELKFYSGKTDFTSNDYLGLARSQELANEIHDRVKSLGLTNGATGSRLLSGNNLLTEELEAKLAKVFNGETSLIFNSGYTANLGVLSTLAGRHDTILYDELSHACIKDGARLSLASRFSFRHNDLNDLEAKIKNAKGQIFIALESIYSMDGDTAPLQEVIKVAKKNNAILILDEAHSTGVMGKSGSGMACHLGIEKEIDFRIYTFGKAMGVHGACVVSSHQAKYYLINFARPFIYTTALPPHSIVAIASAFDFLEKNIELQKKLTEQIEWFRLHFKNESLTKIESKSPIQSILLKGNKSVRILSKLLQDNNLDCRPILSPTVKEGEERIRICLHAFNTKEEIDILLNLINHYSV